MEIILLRHGKPNVELSGKRSTVDFKQLVTAYAQSGIADHPPHDLKGRFTSHYVVSSHLRRSLHSAKKLGCENIHLSDELFAETDIPFFESNIIKLPVIGWLVIFRVMWLFGFNKNGESFVKAKIRAKKAALKLIRLAEENEKVILVGHGVMNRLISRELRLNNWQGPGSPGRKYWEYGCYYSRSKI
jgi:broad specificity phosphatase PhoE